MYVSRRQPKQNRTQGRKFRKGISLCVVGENIRNNTLIKEDERMKKTTRISKKALALIIAMLMILTSVPLVMLPASAASGTVGLEDTDYVTIATEARLGEKGTERFYYYVWAYCDGAKDNTAIGLMKFDITDIPYGTTVKANLLIKGDPAGKINTDANVHIMYATKNFTYGFPANRDNVNWNHYDSTIGGTIESGTRNHDNVQNTYGGVGLKTVSLSELSSQDKNFEIDVTTAVNEMRNAGKSELLLVFATDQAYDGASNDRWSDVGVSKSSTLTWTNIGNTSSTGTPIDNIDADKLDTNITANYHGKFEHDDTHITDADYANVYKNVLWMTPVVYQANPTADSGVVTLNSDSRGGYTATQNTWYNPTTVFLYDGSSEMTTAVMMRSDASYSSGVVWDDQTSRLYASYVDSPSSISMVEKWKGIDGRLNFQYTFFSTAKGYQILGSKAQMSATAYENGSGYKIGINDADMVFLANVMKVTYKMSDSELSKTLTPIFAADQSVSKAADRDNCFRTIVATSKAPLYLVNYVPLKAAIEEAKTAYNKYVAELNANPDKYTKDSIKAFAEAVNALTAAKPNNYNYDGQTGDVVASYATNAADALDKWNKAKTLTLSEYDVTFNLVGRDPVTVKYTWGTTPAVGDGKVPAYVQQNNDTQHSTGNSWPTFETLSADSVKVYNETLTWTDHSYTGKVTTTPTCTSKGETTYTCSCGESYKLWDVPESEHTPGEWIIDNGADATCTRDGQKYKKCTHCLVVVETETIPMKQHEYEFKQTVAPTCSVAGYDLYTCKNCPETKQENPVEASGHSQLFTTGEIAATCTRGGYTGDTVCGVCSEVVTGGTSIKALGHGTVEAGTAELQNYVPATCGAAGYSGDLYCKQCKKVVETGVATNPTGEHVFEWEEVTPATCGTDGTKKQVCSCGAEGETDTIPATDEHIGGEATCIAPAVCASCDHSYGEVNTANHKNTEIRNEEAAGCGADGYSGDKWCLDCKNEIEKGHIITATSQHTGGTATCTARAVCTNCNQPYGAYASHTEGEWVETTPAQCLKDGVKTLYCAECKAVMDTATILYEGHQFVGDAVPNNNGTHSYECTGCDLVGNGVGEFGAVVNDYDYCSYTDHYEDKDDTNHTAFCVCGQSVDAEHTWNETSSTEPTCGEQGETNYKCYLCNGTKIEYEDATGAHVGGTATCKAQAVCTSCNTPYGPLADHTEQTVTGTPATCLDSGLTDGKKCSVCDEVITEQTVIPSPGHSYSGAYSFDAATKTHKQLCVNGCNEYGESVGCSMERIGYNAPTHTAAGNASYKCTVCKGEYGEVLAVVPHSFSEPSMDNLVRPTEDADGYFLITCSCGAEDRIPADRASYVAYNAAVENLKALLEEDITPAAVTAINKALEENKVATDLIKSENPAFNEQPIIDAATKALELAFTNNSGNIQTYTVRFYIDGALVKTQDDILLGGSATAPEGTPEKAPDENYHYNYLGWDKAFDNITASIDVNAVFDPVKHTPKTIVGYGAECLKDGLTDGSKCSVCERILVAQTAIPALRHDYEWVIDTGATCGADGAKHEECKVCHDKRNENTVIDATGAHEYEWIIDDEPTCGEVGKKHEKCKNCTATRNENTAVEATGAHAYESVVTAPTCTADGYTTYTCKACGNSYTDDTVKTEGHNYEWIIDTGATCGTDGIKHEECSVCHDKQKENTLIPATGAHEYEWIIDDEPTCSEAGKKHEKCKNCTATRNENTAVEATGAHAYESVVTAPTCTADGYTTYTCKTCGNSYTDDTVRTEGHKAEIVKGYESTCTKTGLTDGKKCSVCGITLEAQQTIPEKTHSYSTETTTPTCKTQGYTTYTCSVCGYSYNDDYKDAVDHMYAEVNDDAKAPTCTKDGLTGYKQCIWCQVKTTPVVIPATGHSWSEWITKTSATCKNYETQTRSCSVCGETQTRDNVDGGYAEHKYTDVVGKDATCLEGGYTAHKLCSVCGDKLGYSTTTATGHSWGAWETEKSKTCTTYEVQARYCAGCNAKQTRENADGGYAEHNYEPVTGVDATCDEAGYSDHECCDSCGGTKGYTEIPAKGHGDADGDGFCDHCSHDLNKPGADGCICHKNNIFSKIVRLIYTIFSKLFNKRITCCDDMEYYYDIGDIS